MSLGDKDKIKVFIQLYLLMGGATYMQIKSGCMTKSKKSVTYWNFFF